LEKNFDAFYEMGKKMATGYVEGARDGQSADEAG